MSSDRLSPGNPSALSWQRAGWRSGASVQARESPDAAGIGGSGGPGSPHTPRGHILGPRRGRGLGDAGVGTQKRPRASRRPSLPRGRERVTSWPGPLRPGPSVAGVLGATGSFTQLSQSVFRANGVSQCPWEAGGVTKHSLSLSYRWAKREARPARWQGQARKKGSSSSGLWGEGWALGWRPGGSLCAQHVPSSWGRGWAGGALGSSLSTQEPETGSWPELGGVDTRRW